MMEGDSVNIDLYIEPSVIEWVLECRPESFTRDDVQAGLLHARINFIDRDSKASLLLVPEMSLFQLLSGLADAAEQLSYNELVNITLRDFNGSYDLSIVQWGERIAIANVWNKDHPGVYITVEEFLKLGRHLIDAAVKEVEEKMPGFLRNELYISLRERWMRFW